jgi:hypothetical protein
VTSDDRRDVYIVLALGAALYLWLLRAYLIGPWGQAAIERATALLGG